MKAWSGYAAVTTVTAALLWPVPAAGHPAEEAAAPRLAHHHATPADAPGAASVETPRRDSEARRDLIQPERPGPPVSPAARAALSADGPGTQAGESAGGATERLDRSAPSERLTVPRESGPVVEVLPFGAGLACLGLGLGIVGLRMRRI